MGTLYVCLFWYPKWLTKEIICKYINIFLNISMPFLPRVSCIPLNSSIAERQASSSSHCFGPFHKVREIKCCQMKVDQLYFRPLEKNLHADMQLLQIWLINLLTAKLIFQLSCYQTCTGMEGTVSYCEKSSLHPVFIFTSVFALCYYVFVSSYTGVFAELQKRLGQCFNKFCILSTSPEL